MSEFESSTKADIFILKEKLEMIKIEISKIDDKVLENAEDINGLGRRLGSEMAKMHKELSDSIIERTEKSNTNLFDWVKLFGAAVLGAVIAHLANR